MHSLIVGSRGVGKSALIRRVLASLGKPVWGFKTRKEDSLADDELGSPVYIYDAGVSCQQSAGNLIGYCKDHRFGTMKAAFDRYAPRLRGRVPEGCIILMDELGFMESASIDFCSSVLSLLDGDIPVIAAVKDKSTPFLDAVRSHPNCRCFFISNENRDTLYPEVLGFVRQQFNNSEQEKCE